MGSFGHEAVYTVKEVQIWMEFMGIVLSVIRLNSTNGVVILKDIVCHMWNTSHTQNEDSLSYVKYIYHTLKRHQTTLYKWSRSEVGTSTPYRLDSCKKRW